MIFNPQPGASLPPLNIFVNVALIFTVLMHWTQLALLKSTLPKIWPADDHRQKVRIFLFGVFELRWSGRRNLKLKITLLFANKANKARSFIAQLTFIAHCQGVVLLASRPNVCSIPPLCGLSLPHSAYWCLPQSLPPAPTAIVNCFSRLSLTTTSFGRSEAISLSAFLLLLLHKPNDAATTIKPMITIQEEAGSLMIYIQNAEITHPASYGVVIRSNPRH